MIKRLNLLINLFIIAGASLCYAQNEQQEKIFLVSMCVYEGDTIPCMQLREVLIFKPLKFKNEKERKEYDRLVRNVKRTLPIAKEVQRTIIETYEYLETLPNKREKEKHIKRVEKGLKEQYTAQLKKLSFSQGKLLIKLVDREANQTSYELAKAFLGPFKAGFYQAFAGLFGASLKKEYNPLGEDKLTERVVLLVENGQL
ncbi:MAG: DUF4294 domain-containing protein [Mediterranea sp.]|jgi:hypothetical protein|nr:DUF4294 domain-containing protein [Mediterranea sp.]